MEHLRTKILYAAYGWLLVAGVLHFSIDVIAQYLRGKCALCPQTTPLYGLNTAYSLGQVLVGLLALIALPTGNVLGRWSGLTFGFVAAGGWFAVCVLFLESTQPTSVVAAFTVLLGVAAFTS